jgi:hypothetical protein
MMVMAYRPSVDIFIYILSVLIGLAETLSPHNYSGLQVLVLESISYRIYHNAE